jgi:cold shock protein
MVGKVKWFNAQKGYGFIVTEEGNDVFVHYSGVVSEGYKSLQEGEDVQFELTKGKNGDQAVNVTKVQ